MLHSDEPSSSEKSEDQPIDAIEDEQNNIVESLVIQN